MHYVRRARYVAMVLLLCTAACANVKSETYTSSSKDQVTKDVSASHLSDDEKRLYVAAIMRSSFGSYDPTAKTVAQIIDDQKTFEREEAAKEEAAKEAAAKAAAAAAAERRAMQTTLSVQATDKGFQAADYMNGIYEDSITLGVQFHNLGRKKISEAKGALVFSNHFGDQSHAVKHRKIACC